MLSLLFCLKENGFTCQETSAMAANSKWNFKFNESETPVSEIPGGGGANPLLQSDDQYNEMIVDCDDTEKILNYGDARSGMSKRWSKYRWSILKKIVKS